jgi:hypothetical protein
MERTVKVKLILILLTMTLLMLYIPRAYAGWTPMTSDPTAYLYNVWGSSGSDVFAVGTYSTSGDGIISHYNGSTWSTCTIPSICFTPVGVWGSSGSDVFAVGACPEGGCPVILHFDGISWDVEGITILDVFGWPCTYPCLSGLNNIWGSSSTDVFVTGSGMIKPLHDLKFSFVYHYDGTQWSQQFVTSSITPLTGIWGSSGTDVFAVGSRGTILHYNGSTWSSMSSGTTAYLNNVWGSSGSDVFAVGDGGTILHYDGSAWSSMTSGTTNYLRGIWGSTGSDVFAVGSSGTILHYDGSTWSSMISGTTNTLYGAWGSSASDVFAVGSGGTILHFDGIVTTTTIVPPTTTSSTTTTAVQPTTTTTAPPTVIELSSFTATPKAGKVILQWSTATELDNAGFNIYRSEAEQGQYIKINASLIPAKGSSTQGASYEFIDNNVQNRKTYWYKMEDIDLNGRSTMHGPVSATPRLIFGVDK